MITLLHPWALLGLLAVPLAILLLIRRGRPVVLEVPSLIPWRKTPEDDAPGQRRLARDRWLSVLLASTAIVGAVLALVRPVLATSRGEARALVIIDRSASMQARAAEGDGTRLDEAKDAAVELVRGWSGGVRVRVGALPAGTPRVDLTPEQAAAAIRDVTPSALPLDVEGILPIILQPAGSEERVYLFTDRVPAWAEGEGTAGVALASVGGPSDNVGITELEVRPDGFFVSVGNFSAAAADVPVRLGEGGAETVLAIPAGEERSWTAPIPSDGPLSVELDLADGFDLDDRALGGATPRAATFRCAVIGEPYPSLLHALEAIEAVEVVLGSPGVGAGRDADLRIWCREPPPADVEGRHVFLGPRSPFDDDPDPAPVEVADPRTTGDPWEEIPLTGVRLGAARPFVDEAWRPVILAGQGGEAIAAIGQRGAGPVLWIAADPEAPGSNWSGSVSYPLFVAKVLEWGGLPRPGSAPDMLRAGERLEIVVGRPPLRVLDPAGGEIARFDRAGEFALLPEKLGTYTLVDEGGSHRVAVSLLRRLESDLGGDRRALTDAERRLELRGARRVETWPYFVLLFLVAFVAEAFLRRERMRP